MYTLTRGPSKITTQRRTGPTQQVESKLGDLKCRQQQQLGSWPHASPAPKLVFNRVNGKRPPLMPQQMPATEENYTLAHEENVRFVYEAWQQVEQQLYNSCPEESGSGPVQYTEKTPNPELKDKKERKRKKSKITCIWSNISKEELPRPRKNEKTSIPSSESSSPITNFVPIDLEDWWAQQFWAKIENGS